MKIPRPPEGCEAILQRFLALHPKIIDLKLDRVEELLARLGNPQDRLPPVLHVAGTNGKGSTIAFLDSCLQSAGYSVHAYTSPHLIRFAERIRLRGVDIGEEPLYQLLHRCEEANGGRAITYFEITSVGAFLAFSEVPADALLLEVGLGGRLDATNVVKHPEICIITPVGMDHEQYLGTSIHAIAVEKAGILKRGTGAVVAPQEDEAMLAIEACAKDTGAILWRFGKEWRISRNGEDMLYEDNRGAVCLPLPGLVGTHQIINAGVAVAALRHSRFADMDQESLARGIETARWPGRLQPIRGGDLLETLSGQGELWLDGGHNPAAARTLRSAMEEMEKARPGMPLHLVAGMMETKDARGFFSAFRGLARSIGTVSIPGEERCIAADLLMEEARAAGLEGKACDSLADACGEGIGCRVLICGSLHLAGHVLARSFPG